MIIRWLAMGLLAILLAAWHWYQNRYYRARLTHADDFTHALWRLARMRGWQAVAIATVVFAIMLSYDIPTLRQMALPPAPPVPAVIAPPAALEEAEEQLDIIKENYEQAFVNYYFLRRCGNVSVDDYYAVQTSMLDELAKLRAPVEWSERIIQAAQGSYEGVYIDTPCDEKTVLRIQSQFNQYLEQLRSSRAAATPENPS